MTARALILGFIGVIIVCLLSYVNDQLIGNTFLIGNNMPVSIYGTLLVFLLTANVGLFYLGKKYVFSGAELAVILTIILAVCCIPGSGLMRTFVTGLMMPHQYALTDNDLKASGIIDKTPEMMLPDVNSDNQQEVLNTYMAGDIDSFADIIDHHIYARTIS